ncbi:MAG: glutamate--tRNA ligase, partial [Bacteroidales bacterium]|nr:glutamate--tRNA ligase [Bacteroidales bacterium]
LQWNVPGTDTTYSGYRESGYLPEAVVNFLALLGWNPGNDQDIMTMDEMIKLFDLSKCSKNGAHFDIKRLLWFNHHYLQECDETMLVETLKSQVKEHGADIKNEEYVSTVVKMMKERINLPQELWEQCNFFFAAPTEFDEKSLKKWWKPEAPHYVSELCDFMEAQTEWNGETLEPKVMEWIASKEYKTGAVMNAFRVALVGAARGPQIFAITDMLGKEESLRRARNAASSL